MPTFAPPRAAFYLLFTASGFAGLIYESIWTHYLKLFLGHAAYAQSLVLMVFMGGMAAGSAWTGRRSARIANPLLGYALVEAIVGVFALVFHSVFEVVTDWSYTSLLPALGTESAALAAKLAVSCLLILPQSVLLGMTFPLMSAGLVRSHPASAGESVAMLYFTNSLGAALGVLTSGFVLIGLVGLPGTLLAIAFVTGLASFVYEICWIRMLSLVLGASTHSFELMLSTFILGLAIGGFTVRRLVDASAQPEKLLGIVQVAMGLLALATLVVYDRSFELMEYLMKGLARSEAGYTLFNITGQAVAAIVMLPATILAGMTLPIITATLMRRGSGEAAIGKVYAANTLGAIAGVLLAVHVGLPSFGLKGALMFGCIVDVALGLYLLHRYADTQAPVATAAAASLALLVPIALVFQLDANKMTAGVFRHGDLAASRDARILFQKDGKTATVHLVEYPSAVSLRTNGKSDGSINMDKDGVRGSDEITMVLTGAIPLALKPDAKTAAVIGIGTGLTMHTLLQSLSVERVETVEIEAAMAEAARGFLPRNGAAFLDPRGSILVDDAKTFFSTRNRHYDIIISEPSNPWVSGVSSLFTREFYRRIRSHLNPGGVLVQWFQLYEVDPSLLASVMLSLGGEFRHYAVFAPSDHDVLIVASDDAIPLPANQRVFEQPGLAKELWTVKVLSAGDLDARFLGSRATLEPLFSSFGIAPNSDYYPVLDLNAAKHRFMEKSASEVVALLNLGVPVLEMLEPTLPRRQVNPLFEGAHHFERVENARLANYSRDFLMSAKPPEPERVSTQLQKDLEVSKFRLLECREPRERDVWLHSLVRVAMQMNPYLPPEDVARVWDRMIEAPCFATLHEFQRRWIAMFRAVGARNPVRMAELGALLLATQPDVHTEAREYLLMATMTGYLATRQPEYAVRVWDWYASGIRASSKSAFRLLRCHAAEKESKPCADAFVAHNAAR